MRILIAEDDPVSRRLLEAFLDRWGYNPTIVEDGLSAWQAIQTFEAPFLVISDWMMPKMDGLELCRKIRAMESEGYIYFIIVSAKERKEELFHAFEAGIDDYLTKPFNYQELKYRVRIGERILELERRILQLSRTDPLTGILNRRAFMEKFEREIIRSQREKSCMSTVMVDVDHFKSINDAYGHQYGDEVLKALCRTLEKFIRPYDFVGRYGGEEFILCLLGTKYAQCRLIAERVRKAIQMMDVTPEGNGRPVKITASMGVASFCGELSETADTLIAKADSALYRAKREGRNRVCMAETETPPEKAALGGQNA